MTKLGLDGRSKKPKMLKLKKMKSKLRASGFKSTTYRITKGEHKGDKIEYGTNKWGERFQAKYVAKRKKVYY